MAKKVEITTRNGDKLTERVATDAEAAELEKLPFDDASNVAVVKVTNE